MNGRRAILLVDDHDATRETLAEVLSEQGHLICDADSRLRAGELLDSRQFDLVLTDLKLADGTGMDVMRQAKRVLPQTPVVMITGHATIDNAVEATKLGAFEYLTKPVDLNRLRVVVANALRLADLERRVESMNALDALVGQSPRMREVKQLVKQVAHTDATVLIQGESGTGKELIANALQALSARRDGPFVRVNIAALAQNVIESELFGHEKGAFTGAVQSRKGRFELADGGTLFLDEIGEMPLDLQVKLLRVLQEREFERVGGTETLPIDIRLICASNQDLKEQAANRRFREDLYFRINVIRIAAPPLRDRMDDLPLLADHFRTRFAARYGVEKTFSSAAMARLKAYDWPGNVRELENAVESAMVRSSGKLIEPSALPDDVLADPGSPSLRSTAAGLSMPPVLTLAEVEKRHILSTLARLDGNKTVAARELGIGGKTLYRKLEEYGEENAHT